MNVINNLVNTHPAVKGWVETQEDAESYWAWEGELENWRAWEEEEDNILSSSEKETRLKLYQDERNNMFLQREQDAIEGLLKVEELLLLEPVTRMARLIYLAGGCDPRHVVFISRRQPEEESMISVTAKEHWRDQNMSERGAYDSGSCVYNAGIRVNANFELKMAEEKYTVGPPQDRQFFSRREFKKTWKEGEVAFYTPYGGHPGMYSFEACGDVEWQAVVEVGKYLRGYNISESLAERLGIESLVLDKWGHRRKK